MKPLNQIEILAVNGSGDDFNSELPSTNSILALSGTAIGIGIAAHLSLNDAFIFSSSSIIIAWGLIAVLPISGAINFMVPMSAAACTTTLVMQLI